MDIGLKVHHDLYGNGEIVTKPNQNGLITVAFEKEYEVVVGKITDTDNYFEDNRRIEKNNFIEVYPSELIIVSRKSSFLNYIPNRDPNCHSCAKGLSTLTHAKCDKCGWLKCECGSCGCNYVSKRL